MSGYRITHLPALEGRKAQEKELHKGLLTLRTKVVELIARGDSLRAENKRLRAAIKEWAEAEGRWDGDDGDGEDFARLATANMTLRLIASEPDA